MVILSGDDVGDLKQPLSRRARNDDRVASRSPVFLLRRAHDYRFAAAAFCERVRGTHAAGLPFAFRALDEIGMVVDSLAS